VPIGTRVAIQLADVTHASTVERLEAFLSPSESVAHGGAALPEAAPEPSSAGRAVRAAVKAIEALAGSEQRAGSSVVLRFKIGSDDLAVRIAMVDGQPTAEFQSQSAEVREAVLRQWQASVPTDSPLRAREPVFTAGFFSDAREGQSRNQDGRSAGRARREDLEALSLSMPRQGEQEMPVRARSDAGAPASGLLSVFA
jgi:hypothetical protein